MEATPPPRDFQSWAWPAKWVVPAWSRRLELWSRAFDVLAQDPPSVTPVFLHRDFGPHNLLWPRGEHPAEHLDRVWPDTGPNGIV